jgi:hypothetical protein
MDLYTLSLFNMSVLHASGRQGSACTEPYLHHNCGANDCGHLPDGQEHIIWQDLGVKWRHI